MSSLLDNNNEEESLEDLIKQLQELDEVFSDEEPNYQAIIDEFGIDIAELERDMERYEQKINVNYSFSREGSVDPQYAYLTDSGFDLYSTEEIEVPPFGRKLIPTGLHIDIPEQYELQVRSKSGLALKDGLMVLNSPGTVDQGYTGEIQVIIFNANNLPTTIKKGQKIAQAVFSPVACGKWIKFNKVENINNKDRNSNGFGSTGI
jgi:dUTP pyrophosphatase